MIRIPKIKAPEGFKFFIQHFDGRETVYLYLLKKDADTKLDRYGYLINMKWSDQIGRITLEKASRDTYRTHSRLDEEYWGKGYGTLMYARAIQWGLEHDYKITSSGSSSEKAKNVWKGNGIRKYFRIHSRMIEYHKGVYKPRWYAYPKVESHHAHKK